MNYDRIILELLERVSALEEALAQLQSNTSPSMDNTQNLQDFDSNYKSFDDFSTSGSRDTTKYIFEGKLYGKNRLVLAVVHKFVRMNPEVSSEKLMSTFDKSIQGPFGVIRLANEVKYIYNDYTRRFFFQPNEVIHTSTGDCVVCSQWGIFNIGNFITRAEQLGMHIQPVDGSISFPKI